VGQRNREKPFQLKYDTTELTVSREICIQRKLRTRGKEVLKRKLNRERNKQMEGGGGLE
jgi:hypothetical protein